MRVPSRGATLAELEAKLDAARRSAIPEARNVELDVALTMGDEPHWRCPDCFAVCSCVGEFNRSLRHERCGKEEER